MSPRLRWRSMTVSVVAIAVLGGVQSGCRVGGPDGPERGAADRAERVTAHLLDQRLAVRARAGRVRAVLEREIGPVPVVTGRWQTCGGRLDATPTAWRYSVFGRLASVGPGTLRRAGTSLSAHDLAVAELRRLDSGDVAFVVTGRCVQTGERLGERWLSRSERHPHLSRGPAAVGASLGVAQAPRPGPPPA